MISRFDATGKTLFQPMVPRCVDQHFSLNQLVETDTFSCVFEQQQLAEGCAACHFTASG
jgi:hypothetical protein